MPPDSPSIKFDPFGIPAGPEAEQFWRNLTSALFTQIEQDGWDQPNTLFAVMGPVATAAMSETQMVRDVLTVTDPDGAHTLYRLVQLAAFHDNGRRTLPGMYAPTGTAALLLVTENWRSSGPPIDPNLTLEQVMEYAARLRVSEAERPSNAADRVETRQAMIMEPDGSKLMISYPRGSNPSLPAELEVVHGHHLSGVLIDLMSRCYQLPVKPDVTVGEVLGTVVMLGITQMLTQNPDKRNNPDAVVYGILYNTAHLLDALNTPYDEDPRDRELAAVFSGRPDLSSRLDEMLAFEATGPLFAAARQVNKEGWDGFFARPGATRWLRTDEEGVLLTPALRDWYGPAHLARFITYRLPTWQQAYDGLQGTVGDVASFVAATMNELGWSPRNWPLT